MLPVSDCKGKKSFSLPSFPFFIYPTVLCVRENEFPLISQTPDKRPVIFFMTYLTIFFQGDFLHFVNRRLSYLMALHHKKEIAPNLLKDIFFISKIINVLYGIYKI